MDSCKITDNNLRIYRASLLTSNLLFKAKAICCQSIFVLFIQQTLHFKFLSPRVAKGWNSERTRCGDLDLSNFLCRYKSIQLSFDCTFILEMGLLPSEIFVAVADVNLDFQIIRIESRSKAYCSTQIN